MSSMLWRRMAALPRPIRRRGQRRRRGPPGLRRPLAQRRNFRPPRELRTTRADCAQTGRLLSIPAVDRRLSVLDVRERNPLAYRAASASSPWRRCRQQAGMRSRPESKRDPGDCAGTQSTQSSGGIPMAVGRVKWFNDEKGWGFIKQDAGPDVFVHYSQIQGDGRRRLYEDEVVEFEIKEGPKGLQAINVVRQDGASALS